jgi:hypothetical protein
MQRQLISFLRNRDKLPETRTGYLAEGTSGVFERDTAFTPKNERIGPNGRIIIQAGMPPIFANATLTHELAHAADGQLTDQHFDTRDLTDPRDSSRFMPKKGDQFNDAWQKLRLGRNNENRRAEFAAKLDPKWTAAKSDYRSTSNELAGWGAGSTVGAPGYGEAPPHINSTMATELAIMMELADRMRAAKAKRK